MMLSIVISFLMVEKTDSDAETINLLGSMRMQTYKIGLALKLDNKNDLNTYIHQLDNTWNNHYLNAFITTSNNAEIAKSFELTKSHWIDNLKPLVLEFSEQNTANFPKKELDKQAFDINHFVSLYQSHAENKNNQLRTVLLASMFISTLIAAIIFYILKRRIEWPLNSLIQTAKKMGQGNFTQHLYFHNNDELQLLADTLNQSSKSIRKNQTDLEEKINAKTKELSLRNSTLNFLFSIADEINRNQTDKLNVSHIINTLSDIIEVDNIELCLLTPEGDHPFQQDTAHNAQHCQELTCNDCRIDTKKIVTHGNTTDIKFPIKHNNIQYGVLVARCSNLFISGWKEQLMASVADQVAIALSTKEQTNNTRRLVLSNERSVIARELHDSLAQSLSYLQIQVSRLQKNQDNQAHAKQPAVINELREGLSSAYQHLRELLTTFRLQMSPDGLHQSLFEAIETLQQRTNIHIQLNYDIHDLPMSPAEEIHLMQIIREGTQNAIKHSQGKSIQIRLSQIEDKQIEISIIDDGVGLPEKTERLNHYGLSIMQERSNQLSGELNIHSNPNRGTQVRFVFTPSIIIKSA